MGCALSKNLRGRTTQAEAWLSVLVFQPLSDSFLSRSALYTFLFRIFDPWNSVEGEWYGLLRVSLMDDREKTMHALGAATLSILPGMGHLYLGVKRGNIFLVCGILLLIISKFFWSTGWLIYLQFAILAGFDAFAFGKRGRGLF